jgi:hypothetical protein
VSEAVFNVVQLGLQVDTTTAHAATAVFPLDAGVVIDGDRSPNNPDEDYGQNAAAQPSRGTYGLRAATISATGSVNAENFMYLLQMHACHVAAPTGGAGAYIWTYNWDLTSDTKKRYTIEAGVVGDANDQWRAVGCLVDTLEYGFDTLAAPGNAPWKFTAGIEGLYREQSALTGALTAPDPLETFEGHMTSLYEGPVGTAFDSLSEITGTLVSFKANSSLNLARRAYGGITDYASAWGPTARKTIAITAELKISATSKGDILDVYELAGSLMTERRWRIRTRGSRLTTQNEVQLLTMSTAGGAATGGTFTLAFEGATTTALPYNESAANVQVALRALPTINGANCTVSGSAGGPYTVTFIGTKASLPQLLIQANTSLVTGPGSPYTMTVARTTAGGMLKQLTQDMRVRFNTVNIGNRDGEHIYTVEGIAVKDATLVTDVQTVILNNTATLV